MIRARILVRVVESRAVSYAYGLVGLAAASAGTRGADLEEAARAANAEVGRSTTLIVVDTVEFLFRSRRIGRMRSWLAHLLDLKPLLGSCDGVMVAAELGPAIACHTGPEAVGFAHGRG